MRGDVPDFPTAQDVSKAVAEELELAKSRGGEPVSLLPALTPDSPLAKSVSDALAPIMQALEAIGARLDRLEGRDRGAK
jgi:hypothetical protein